MILITIAAVAFFVLALSLTQIFRGRDIDGEVGTNANMQRLGLECPAREGGKSCHAAATSCTSCAECSATCPKINS